MLKLWCSSILFRFFRYLFPARGVLYAVESCTVQMIKPSNVAHRTYFSRLASVAGSQRLCGPGVYLSLKFCDTFSTFINPLFPAPVPDAGARRRGKAAALRPKAAGRQRGAAVW